MNAGKQFEKDFKASVPKNVYYIRLKDGGGWSNANNTRFTASNECDCILYDGLDMYMLEFKSHQGKSLPLSCIREKQLESLIDAEHYKIVAGFVVNFRDVGRTFFVTARKVDVYLDTADRKSIPLEWFIDNGVELKAELKKTRYTYDVADFCARAKTWI